MTTANIEDAQLTILLEIDGKLHLVGMKKDKFDAIQLLVKNSVEVAVPLHKTQQELITFLDAQKFIR